MSMYDRSIFELLTVLEGSLSLTDSESVCLSANQKCCAKRTTAHTSSYNTSKLATSLQFRPVPHFPSDIGM
jgi:hypothetical protein